MFNSPHFIKFKEVDLKYRFEGKKGLDLTMFNVKKFETEDI